MDTSKVLNIIRSSGAKGFDIYERRPGQYQLIVPILHEDGDMVDIYLLESSESKDSIRICDFGMTLMRLSYTYEINTDSRQKAFDSILINNGIKNCEGNLYLDANLEMLYECILQFAGGIQKVCNMSYWGKESTPSSLFYKNMDKYVTTDLSEFCPKPNQTPLPDYKTLIVDWSLTHNNCNFYLFGVRGNHKAKSTAISLLEFKEAKLPFISLIVYDDMNELGKKEIIYLNKNANNEYLTLADCQDKMFADIHQIAA